MRLDKCEQKEHSKWDCCEAHLAAEDDISVLFGSALACDVAA